MKSYRAIPSFRRRRIVEIATREAAPGPDGLSKVGKRSLVSGEALLKCWVFESRSNSIPSFILIVVGSCGAGRASLAITRIRGRFSHRCFNLIFPVFIKD